MKYLVYLIENSRGRRYVGMTNNFVRRLRQHNGEIVGGARATRMHRPWKPVCTVHGFRSKRDALKFEWVWHHPRKSRLTKHHRPMKRDKMVQLQLILDAWHICDLVVRKY